MLAIYVGYERTDPIILNGIDRHYLEEEEEAAEEVSVKEGLVEDSQNRKVTYHL